MVAIDELLILKPDSVGWTEEVKAYSIIIAPVGNPQITSGLVIKNELKTDDINIKSSATIDINVDVKLEASTYLALKQKISKLYYTILLNVEYELELYYYDPDTKDRVKYDSTNFAIANKMVPLADPAEFKWVLTASSDIEDGKSPEAKLQKVNGVYSKKIKLTFKSVRYK